MTSYQKIYGEIKKQTGTTNHLIQEWQIFSSNLPVYQKMK